MLFATDGKSISQGGNLTTRMTPHNAKICKIREDQSSKDRSPKSYKEMSSVLNDTKNQESTWNGTITSGLLFSGGPFVMNVKTEEDIYF